MLLQVSRNMDDHTYTINTTGRPTLSFATNQTIHKKVYRDNINCSHKFIQTTKNHKTEGRHKPWETTHVLPFYIDDLTNRYINF